MISRIALLLTLLTLFILPSGTASAHVLENDGDIGAVLHIEPDDNPKSGKDTNFVFAFDDTTNKFRLSDCDCTITILEDGKPISSKPLAATNDLESSNTFTFPKAAVYTLKVGGTPKNPESFQPFVLNFTVRVTSGETQKQNTPTLLWIGMAGLIGLIMLAAYTMDLSYNDGNKPKED